MPFVIFLTWLVVLTQNGHFLLLYYNCIQWALWLIELQITTVAWDTEEVKGKWLVQYNEQIRNLHAVMFEGIWQEGPVAHMGDTRSAVLPSEQKKPNRGRPRRKMGG